MPKRPIQAGIESGREDSEEPGALDEARLRDVFSRWASGVTIVAVRDEPHVYAIAATAFTPLSLEPPLVLVCVGPNATVLPYLEPGGRTGISILAEGQRRAASIAADGGPLTRTLFPSSGDPLVPDALAGLACVVRENHPGGDHVILVAEVRSVVLGRGTRPLIYHRRTYGAMAEAD